MAGFHNADLRCAKARRSGCLRTLVVGLVAGLTGLAALAAPVASAKRPHRRHVIRGCPGARTPIPRASRAATKAAVVCLINVQRTHRGLPALRENFRLDRSAQDWTNVMVRVRGFSHGADFASRISAVGFTWQSAGENIAAGFETPTSVVRAWMASPGHCRNILAPQFLDVGTGVSQGAVAGSGGRGTWTQDFGLPRSAQAPSGNLAPANGCPY